MSRSESEARLGDLRIVGMRAVMDVGKFEGLKAMDLVVKGPLEDS